MSRKRKLLFELNHLLLLLAFIDRQTHKCKISMTRHNQRIKKKTASDQTNISISYILLMVTTINENRMSDMVTVHWRSHK